MAQKISIPKGTRDFGPAEMRRRQHIFGAIRRVFALYGFEPIETPAMENLSTLTGKYGEEGDRLLFKVLDSGDFLQDVAASDLEARNLPRLASAMCGKGLRYDLTVPFARYVVQHRDKITFPFRRYQLQPVWRADRPQKGRYREFYQCDADVVGSSSLMHEAELLMIADQVFRELDIDTVIKINNRKVLSGVAELIGRPDLLVPITVAIDKLDKIGAEGVEAELLSRGLEAGQVSALRPLLSLAGSNVDKLEALSGALSGIPRGLDGVAELREVLGYLEGHPMRARVEVDPALARGLDYYTGCIVEVKAQGVAIGSICGGGRYDSLTGVFGLDGVSGVGISFGADRIYDVLEALGRFPASADCGVRAMFANFGPQESRYCLAAASRLRAQGVAVEVYPDNAKIKKQMSYADTRGIPYAIFVGADEMQHQTYSLKNMSTGEQLVVDFDGLLQALAAPRA